MEGIPEIIGSMTTQDARHPISWVCGDQDRPKKERGIEGEKHKCVLGLSKLRAASSQSYLLRSPLPTGPGGQYGPRWACGI